MKWREYACELIIFAAIIYLILTTMAMILSPGHSFFSNVISDLGRTEAFSGESNMISRVFFFTAMSIFGLSSAFLFLALPYHFKENTLQKSLSRIGSVCGVISGIGLIGLGATPSDLASPLHLIFVMIAYLTVLLGSILYFILIYLKDDFPNRYAYILLIFAIYLIINSLVMIFGPPSDSAEGSLIQGTLQKFMIYYWGICHSILGFGALQLYKKNPSIIE